MTPVTNPARPLAEALEGRQLMSTVIALQGRDQLLFVDSTAPDTLLATVKVRGLQRRESLVGIDFRPATGQLYGVGDTSRVYLIDPTTGTATAAGATAFTPALNGAEFGVDFNPVVDRLRLVSDADQNVRLDQTTGASAATDTALAYAPGDTAASADPAVVAAAYTQNVAGATATTLYGIDATRNTLVLQGSVNGTPDSPNAGLLTTVGELGVDTTAVVGLDIETTGPASVDAAYAALSTSERGRSGLYTVNLGTGQATLIGEIGKKRTPVRDIAVAPAGQRVLTVDARNTLRVLDSSLPNVVQSTRRVTGLGRGERIVGIDRRPSNGNVFALTNRGQLYTVNPDTAAATAVGSASAVPLERRAAYGFDFNPTVDRIRVVNAAGQNLRMNPDTGAAVDANTATTEIEPDGDLAFATGDANASATPRVVGAAYTNNLAAATTTALYVIDAGRDVLATQGSLDGTTTSPNTGQLFTVGALGINAGDLLGFEIVTDAAGTTQTALAATKDGRGPLTLYSINLTSGAATAIGALAKRTTLVGMTVI